VPVCTDQHKEPFLSVQTSPSLSYSSESPFIFASPDFL